MKYCSNCAQRLIKEIPKGDNRERFVCPACNEIHYQNPKVVTGCLVVHDDRILLCRRAIHPRKGLWTLPAGFLENSETTAEGAKRETFEEPLIASTTTRDLDKIKTVNDLETEWTKDSAAYTKLPHGNTQRSFQGESSSTRKRFVPEVDATLPNNINWVPRKTNLPTVTPEPQARNLDKSDILTMNPASNTSGQKSTLSHLSDPHQYTIQVGAYKTESNANQMVSNLLEKGYRAHINSNLKDGAPLFKVHIEEFNNKKEARKLADKLATKENLSNFVTTISVN